VTPSDTTSRNGNTISQDESGSSNSKNFKAVPIVVIPEESESSDQVIVKPLEGDLPSIHARLANGIDSKNRSGIPQAYKLDVQLDEEQDDREGGRETAGGLGDGGNGDDDDDGPGEVEEGMYLKSKLWWLGQGLITAGEFGNFLSYGFAPASVVAPLGTVVSDYQLFSLYPPRNHSAYIS